MQRLAGEDRQRENDAALHLHKSAHDNLDGSMLASTNRRETLGVLRSLIIRGYPYETRALSLRLV